VDWNPCLNEGTCYQRPDGEVACKCRFNFEGKFCTPIDMCAKFRYEKKFIPKITEIFLSVSC